MGEQRGVRTRVGSVQRIGLLLLALVLVASVSFGVARAAETGVRHGTATTPRPLLGITGNIARFKSQTGQASTVHHAFLGWGQGLSYGSTFAALFPTLAPIPMLHLGTEGRNGGEAITPGGIAAGQGDGYLIALNRAAAVWNKGLYVRPLAEMNNAGTDWSGYRANGQPKDAAHSPATYRKAFARIYVILHGGSASAVAAKLRQLGLPPLRGGELLANPFPRLRVVWSPLASDNPRVPGNAAELYYPGTAFVDVEGADIYDERLTDTAPWQGVERLYRFATSHRKPFSIPEWGLARVDDPAFVQHMCTFLKTHRATEVAVFYESRPPSDYDLEPKPKSRAAYRACITPLAGKLPAWAVGNAPGSGPKLIALTLTADPDSGEAPLDVSFSIAARLSVPIVHWQLAFGDGEETEGSGPPPASVPHTYPGDGSYEATLIVYPSPPFAPESARFLTSAGVVVGTGAPQPVAFAPTPVAGTAPLAVSFRTDLDLGSAPTGWRIVLGDGNTLQGSGSPPRFTGHTYASPGRYRVLLIVNAPGGRRFLALGDLTVAARPKGRATGTPTGTVLVNGRPFAGGQIPFGAKVDVTKGTLRLTTDVGTLLVYGKGSVAIFLLRRATDRGKPAVELRLAGGNFGVCKRAFAERAAVKPPPKVVRHLWAKGKGRFRTRGRYAAATVRGTAWLTADRCDGTLTRVTQGTVQVSDLPLRKNVQVRAGKSYLAKKP
jgi:PKD repeat protein